MKLILFLFCFSLSILHAQVGIGTTTPNATLQVVGDASNVNSLDGIIPPKSTGDEIQAKNYTAAQNGAMIYATSAATTLTGQVQNIASEGLYVFSSNEDKWNPLSTTTATIPLGSGVSIYREVDLVNNEYLATAGLIEIENTIRVTLQRNSVTLYKPYIQNISGAPITITTNSHEAGATNQVKTHVNVTVANNAYQGVELDNLAYWSSISETLTSQVVLPNNHVYEIRWLAFQLSAALPNTKRIFMSARRVF